MFKLASNVRERAVFVIVKVMIFSFVFVCMTAFMLLQSPLKVELVSTFIKLK